MLWELEVHSSREGQKRSFISFKSPWKPSQRRWKPQEAAEGSETLPGKNPAGDSLEAAVCPGPLSTVPSSCRIFWNIFECNNTFALLQCLTSITCKHPARWKEQREAALPCMWNSVSEGRILVYWVISTASNRALDHSKTKWNQNNTKPVIQMRIKSNVSLSCHP